MATESKDSQNKAVATEQVSSSKALEHKNSKFSLIWVVPLIALILTGLLIWNNTFNIGPQITIITNSADGIEKGKTLVKVRSVVVGTVTDVSLTKDYKHTVLSVQMNKDTEDLLRPDTLFWVVKPRIENTGISGLDTLLSGAYLQLRIGKEEGLSKHFEALEDPPVRLGAEKGLMLTLISKSPKRLHVGATVLFRGFDVGKVTETYFDMESQTIHYQLFIRDPYAQMVNKSTRFWINSGLDLKLDPSGVTLNTESLDNIIVGGIAFDNFTTRPVKLGYIPENSYFELFPCREDARLSWLEEGLLYVVLLEDSIFKIVPGSTVNFNGVKIGEVVKAPWLNHGEEVFTSSLLPVLISLSYDSIEAKDLSHFIDTALKNHKLCAQLGSANILLGNNQIDLMIDKEGKCSTDNLKSIRAISAEDGLMTYNQKKIIPLVPTQALTVELNNFIEKLNEFDVGGFSAELQKSLQAFSGAMESFTASNNLIQQTEVVEKLAESFENFNKTVQGFGPESALYKSLELNLTKIQQLLQDLSPAVSEAGQTPSSIIFGGPTDPIPRAN